MRSVQEAIAKVNVVEIAGLRYAFTTEHDSAKVYEGQVSIKAVIGVKPWQSEYLGQSTLTLSEARRYLNDPFGSHRMVMGKCAPERRLRIPTVAVANKVFVR